MMTEHVEDCLGVVIEAVTTCNLPAEEALAWCSAMLDADRVGFIAREPLEVLRGRVQAARPCGQELGDRRCPGYFSMTIRAATQAKARKLAAFFSYRVATRRYCLACAQNRSARFRSRYRCRSISL
jgi:hypothetical protein